MMSELEFKTQTHTYDKLEELETIIVKRLPVISLCEIIDSIQDICNSMNIKMNIKDHAESIEEKSK